MSVNIGLDRRDAWSIGGAVLLAVAAFAATGGFGFVYDDVHIIVDRPDLHSLANWRQILTDKWWPTALYRPFSRLTLAVDWAVSDGNPGYFHLVNVLMHAAATACVYLLARRWLAGLGAAVAASLFAVHPVHVEAVANVVGRAEVLATLFAVAAALTYRWDGDLAAAADTSWRRVTATLGTLGFLGLGLASKETAFAIPGVLLIVDWLDSRALGVGLGDRVRHHGWLWFGSVALAVEWLVFRAMILGDLAGDHPGPGLFGEDFVGRVLIMAPVLLEYIRLLVFPLHLAADYSPNALGAESTLSVRGVLGFAALGLCVLAAVRSRHSAPIVTFGLAWIGGTLLIVSNVIVPTGVLLAERSLYLPSVGLTLLVGWGAEVLARRLSVRHAAMAVTAVLALAAVRTVARAPVWKAPEVFFTKLIEDQPASFRSQWTAGMLYYQMGRRDVGEQLVRAAVVTYPLYPNTWHDLGTQMQEDSRWAEAAGAFAAAFNIDSTRLHDAASAITNYTRIGQMDSALAMAARARAIDPYDERVLLAMGDIAIARGRPLEAMTWRRQAAVKARDEADYWFLTAVSAHRARYCPEFVRSLDRVLALNPAFPHRESLEALARELECDR